MASQAKENLEVNELTVLADRGYYSGKEFKLCYENDITPIVSKAIHKSATDNSKYSKNMFIYHEEKNVYICPQGAILAPMKSRKPKAALSSVKYVNYQACQNCNVRTDCTTSKQGRKIEDKHLLIIPDR